MELPKIGERVGIALRLIYSNELLLTLIRPATIKYIHINGWNDEEIKAVKRVRFFAGPESVVKADSLFSDFQIRLANWLGCSVAFMSRVKYA